MSRRRKLPRLGELVDRISRRERRRIGRRAVELGADILALVDGADASELVAVAVDLVALGREIILAVRPEREAPAGFHWRDGIRFVRRPDGGVVVILPGEPDLDVPAAEWVSIVAAVSAGEGSAEAYDAARALHGAGET